MVLDVSRKIDPHIFIHAGSIFRIALKMPRGLVLRSTVRQLVGSGRESKFGPLYFFPCNLHLSNVTHEMIVLFKREEGWNLCAFTRGYPALLWIEREKYLYPSSAHRHSVLEFYIIFILRLQ